MNTSVDIITIDILRLIYDLLPPIYRVQFARVSRLWYSAAPMDMRDMNAIIRARLPHPYINEVFTCGGYIAGNFLLDCLYGTSYTKFINLVFGIGVMHHSYLLLPRPDKILKEEQHNDALRSFNRFVNGIHVLQKHNTWTTQTTTCKVRSVELRIPSFNYRRIYIPNAIGVKLIITAPGAHNYMNACFVEFSKILYTGTTFIISDIMSIIRRESSVKDVGNLILTSVDDSGADIECREDINTLSINKELQSYVDRGFAIDRTELATAV